MTYRLLLPLVLGFAGFASSAHGATFSANFNSFAMSDVAGQGGWTINDPQPKVSFIASLFNPAGGGSLSQAAALGGYNDSPTLTNVELTHVAATSLSGASFDADINVEASTALFPGRDNFGFSFKDGSSNRLFSVILKPNALFANQLEVQWQGPTGGVISTGFDIFTSAIYHLDVDFASIGTNGLFIATLTPGTGSPITWGNALPLVGSSIIATVNADWDVNASPGGDNFLIFDNLVMVPEPSSALLLGLALFGAVRRRRTV